MKKPSIVIVDDFEREVSDVIAHANGLGFRTVFCRSVLEAKSKWKEEQGFDVVVLDLNLESEGVGFDFVFTTKESPGMGFPTVFIFSSFLEEFKVPVRILRQVSRIYPYDKKEPREVEALKRAIKEEYERLTSRGASKPVVESPELRKLHDELPLIARSGLSVIITGETGCGKEYIARRIAEMSGRNETLIRTVNCAAFAETLLMSELFGHVKGSFTGADSHRLGLVLEASGYQHDGTKGYEAGTGIVHKGMKDYVTWLSSKASSKPGKRGAPNGETCYGLPAATVGGTLILDEVAELAPIAQASLLRVLDGLPIKPVGHDGLGFLPNLRVISVTNDIATLGKQFRPDLLGRLNEWHIHLPPIKDRPLDARAIVRETASRLESRNGKPGLAGASFEVDEEAMKVFLSRLGNLKGGIRELKSWTRRACIFADRDQINVVTEKHAKHAWERSFRVADRSRGGLDHINEEKQLREAISTAYKSSCKTEWDGTLHKLKTIRKQLCAEGKTPEATGFCMALLKAVEEFGTHPNGREILNAAVKGIPSTKDGPVKAFRDAFDPKDCRAPKSAKLRLSPLGAEKPVAEI